MEIKPMEENETRFISLCREIHRDGIEDLIKYLGASDFFSAPASAKYHGAYPGGLCQHSLNVYDEYVRLLNIYPEVKVDPESVIVMSLLHDLCKINFYKPEKKNRKNAEGRWESYDSYGYEEKFKFGGHGSKSVFIAQNFIKLKPEEAVAINCHMGSWDGNKDVGGAYEQFPEAWLLHVADEAATYLRENAE